MGFTEHFNGAGIHGGAKDMHTHLFQSRDVNNNKYVMK